MRRAVLVGAALVLAGCSLIPRPGDPNRLVADDPRVKACGIPIADMWMAFAMEHASDVDQHFPGWTEGNDELHVPDPALVIIGPALPWKNGEGMYSMCIAVGPPDDALVHHYGYTRFDGVRPDLGGPVVPMP